MNNKSLQNLKPSWKKGESGNPNGRPKGKSLKTRIYEALYSTDNPRIDKMIESLFKQAEKGNIQAMKLVFEYLDKYDTEIQPNKVDSYKIQIVSSYMDKDGITHDLEEPKDL